jgi:FkbM family methyltransferase
MLLLEKLLVSARNRIAGPNNAVVRWLRPAYINALDLLTLRRGIPRTLNNEETIRVSVRYRSIDENYEPGVYQYLKKSVRPGDTVLDIGAHVGIYTILLARWTGPHGHVFAIEPCCPTVELLTTNVRLNRVEPRVTVINAAMGEMAGAATLYSSGPNCENTLCPIPANGARGFDTVTVPMDTVDHLCASRGISPRVVKIDVEGYELHVLRGMTRILGERPLILLEMHPFAWPALGYDHRDFAEFFRSHGLKAVGLSGQAHPLEEYGNVYLTARDAGCTQCSKNGAR